MKRASLVSAAVVALAAPAARACPCGTPAGGIPAWTGPSERVAVSLGVGWVRELGAWDHRARAHANPANVRSDRALFEAAAAWRATPSVELSLAAAAAYTDAALDGVAYHGAALGDLTLRARWDGPFPFSERAPRVSLWSGARIPTGDAATNQLAGAVAGIGLGHVEVPLGVELRWRFGAPWELAVATELGVRLPAERGGATVLPGPRALVAISGVWRPTTRVAVTLGLNAWFELAPWIEGASSGEHAYRFGPVAGASVQLVAALRASLSVAVDPPVDGFGANATANARTALAITWSR